MIPVHRNKDVEMVDRLSVRAYPQLICVDGYGRPVEGISRGTPRSADRMVEFLKRVSKVRPDRFRPPKLPSTLAMSLRNLEPKLKSPDPFIRTAAWKQALASTRLKSEQKALCFTSAPDDYIQLLIFRSVDSESAKELTFKHYDETENDVLRILMIESLAINPDRKCVSMIKDLLERGLGKSNERLSYSSNSSNLFFTANKVAIELASPDLSRTLVEVVEEYTPASLSWRYALEALKKTHAETADDKIKKVISEADAEWEKWQQSRRQK